MSFFGSSSPFDILVGAWSAYNGWQQYTAGDPASKDHEHMSKHLWAGVVTDNNDPLKHGRVKVRIWEVHGDASLISNEDLPWAHVMSPTTSAGISGLGHNSFLVNGSSVLLIPVNAELQMWIIAGTIPTFSYDPTTQTGTFNEASGFKGVSGQHPLTYATSDTNVNALGDINPKVKTQQWSPFNYEPGHSCAPIYTKNHVYATESGHTMEFDDSQGAERIELNHMTGTGWEMNAAGDVVTRVNGAQIDLVQGDKVIEVQGSAVFVVSGSATITAAKGVDVHSAGDINIHGSSNAHINIDGLTTINGGDSIKIHTHKDCQITAGNDITLRTEPEGTCKGDIDGYYPTRASCMEAAALYPALGYEWVTAKDSNIDILAFDNINLVARTGSIKLKAGKDIQFDAADNVKSLSGIDTDITSRKDTNIHAGGHDFVCTNFYNQVVDPAGLPLNYDKPSDNKSSNALYGTPKDRCEDTGSCYVNSVLQHGIHHRSVCENLYLGTFYPYAWTADKNASVNIEGEIISLETRSKHTDGNVKPSAKSFIHMNSVDKNGEFKNFIEIDGQDEFKVKAEKVNLEAVRVGQETDDPDGVHKGYSMINMNSLSAAATCSITEIIVEGNTIPINPNDQIMCEENGGTWTAPVYTNKVDVDAQAINVHGRTIVDIDAPRIDLNKTRQT